MIKGLISHKVRQSAPKPPVKKCSPSRATGDGKRGRKTVAREAAPLVATSILELDKGRYPHVSNEVWNALSSAFRSSLRGLLESLEAFSRDSRNDPLELLQDTIPQWAYQVGREVMESVLVDKTGFLGSRLKCDGWWQDDIAPERLRSPLV